MPDMETHRKIKEAAKVELSSIRASVASIESYLARPRFRKLLITLTHASNAMKRLQKQSGLAFDPLTALHSYADAINDEVKTIESLCDQNGIDLEVIRRVWEVKRQNKKVVLLLAPFFNETRLRDGYFRRIQAIDEILGEECLKVYVTPASYVLEGESHLLFPDALHLDLQLDFEDPEEKKLLELIAQMADLVYYHSVAFVNSATLGIDTAQILDLHGSVPEELLLQGNPEQAAIEGEKEKLALEKVQYAVVVSNAMADHLREKYPNTNVRFITLPILDVQITETKRYLDPKPYLEGKPFVAYVGGLQKWQLIPRMQSLIDSTNQIYNYQILVPSPDEFLSYWKEKEIPPIMISSGGRETVKKICERSHYGLLLREDIVVNRVSCPTKLVEYLALGVVPVLISNSIGDFSALGMRHISLEDFESNRLPTEAERLQIVLDNYACLEKIIDLYYKGKNGLQNILSNV